MDMSCKDKILMFNWQEVSELLVQGKESATTLQSLFQEPYTGLGCVSVDGLVDKVLGSFSDALSVLCGPGDNYLCQNLASSLEDSAYCNDLKSENSCEGLKRPPSKDRNRRGCYKRKKISEGWTTITPTIEDGGAWRKYGQKEILNAKYPRSYFRCTHKYDRGCKATKQVQRMEGDQQLYHITYIGHHTCKNVHMKASELIITDYGNWESNNMIRFGAETPKSIEHDHTITSSSTSSSLKQESKELETPSEVVVTNNLSPLDSFIWKDLKPIDSSVATMEYGTGNVLDGIYSSYKDTISYVDQCNFDMDFMAKPIDFEYSDFCF